MRDHGSRSASGRIAGAIPAPGPAGPWAAEGSAEVDPDTGAFALPAGSVGGRFFRAEVETKTVFE